MNFRYLYITLVLFLIPAYHSHSQDSCENPLPPELISVSVVTETSSVLVNWELSKSSDIAAYVIYLFDNRNGNMQYFALDTVWNNRQTYYADRRLQYKSFQYRVAAYRLPKCVSEMSNELSTIFVKAVLDECIGNISLSWNPYTPPDPLSVTNYTIYQSHNGNNFSFAGIVDAESTNFTVNDFTINSEYCFKVVANLNTGSTSESYTACVSTNMQKAPEWINADYATVTDDNAISLSFTIDPASEAEVFSLERRTGFSGSFSQISLLNETQTGKVTYTDKTTSDNTIYFYRLSALNPCDTITSVSNMSSNILLGSQTEENEIKLRWNHYRHWEGIVSSYSVFMDVGSGFIQSGMAMKDDTTLTISIPDIKYDLKDASACFYVLAEEAGNPYGIAGRAKSNISCVTIDKTITVPNIFTPDGNLINDLFRPVLTYAPDEYRLVITDRQGKIIFETYDYNESWDGRDKNGSPVMEGVYLWFIRIKTIKGNNVSRSGTVTLIR